MAPPPGSGLRRGEFASEFDHLIEWSNLRLAYRKASKGKRGRSDVAAFELCLEDNLLDLQADLQARTYRPGGYRSFFIHEPKRRRISAAPFRDRVVHHALCNVIEERFERSFVSESFANRVGKGTHRALEHAQDCAQRFRFVVQLDIRQFFPSIDHEILFALLRRKIEDSAVLWLIGLILASGEGVLADEYDQVFFPGDDLWAALRPRGLPIGNLTSQFWANVYMSGLDHKIKRQLRCRGYARYVDDLLLFSNSKRELWMWKGALGAELERLRLKVHPGVQPRPVPEGVPFLGFVIYPHKRLLKRRKAVHYRRRLRGKLRASTQAEEPLRQSVQSWLNHCRYGNTFHLCAKLLAEAGVSCELWPEELAAHDL